ncbi:MAG: sulfatase [Bacteroidota bacterium]
MKDKLRLSILLLFSILIFNSCKVKKNKGIEVTEKPNLVIIQTDEHNFRTLGCYREQLSHDQAYVWGEGNNVETPNIDQLADNGMLFTKFYASAPVCSPSRGSMVSGMYPQHTGVPGNDFPMKDEVITYAKVLNDAGYKTGFIGKWHLNGHGKPEWDPERNFGFEDNRYMFNRGHWKKFEDTPTGPKVASVNEKGAPSYSVDGADEFSFATDFLTNKTLDFIKDNKKEPFLIHVSFPDPHGPDKVRAPYDTMYSDMKYEAPVTFNVEKKDAPKWAGPQRKSPIDQSQYFGMVKCIDDNVGRIISYLEENDLTDNTIIVFISDHGDLRAEHHRHNKGNPFEASAKVPFIVSYPAAIKPGSVVNNAFNMVDFAPTVLSFMNQQVPGQMEGIDFSSILKDSKKETDFEDITFSRQASKKTTGWVATITSRYKLVLSPGDKPWLFDLQEDPNELINYFEDAKKQDVVKELAAKMKEYGVKFSDPYLSADTKMANDLKTILK